MRALILAAGFGSRLLEHTTNIPKALVEVAGKPILEYQIEALLQNGIKSINIVIGYQGGKIIDYLRKYHGNEVEFHYRVNNEYDQSNSSYSFWIARSLIYGAPYIHLNCDIIFNAETLDELIQSQYSDAIIVDKNVELADNMEQVLLDGNKITKMNNMRFPGACGKAMGLAKLSSSSVEWISKRIGEYVELGDKNQNFYGIIREAVKCIDIHALQAKAPIFEVNSTLDLENVSKGLLELSEEVD